MPNTLIPRSGLFWASCITALVIVFRDILSISVPGAVLLLLIVALMMCLRYQDCVGYFFFLFPFTCGIPGYTVLGAFIILLYKSKHYTKLQFIPLAIVAFLEIIDEGLTADSARISGMVSFLTFVAVFFYFLNDKQQNEYNIAIVIKYYVVGVIVTFVIVYYNMIHFYGVPYLLSGMARSGALGVENNDTSEMMGHIAMNANTIAYIAICSITSLVVMMPQIKSKILPLTMIAILVIGGVLSFSRTYIACLVLFFMLYFFLSGSKGKLRFVMIAGIVSIAILYFASSYYDAIFSVFSNRANETNIATAGGRTLLFAEYQQKWLANPFYILFGCGVVDYYPLLHCHNAMHSGIQQIWVCLGLSGLFLFVVQIGRFLYRNVNKKHIIYCLPFILTAIFDQSVQFLNPYPLMLPILVSLMVIKLPRQLKYSRQ